jgi:hypothetical protein
MSSKEYDPTKTLPYSCLHISSLVQTGNFELNPDGGACAEWKSGWEWQEWRLVLSGSAGPVQQNSIQFF